MVLFAHVSDTHLGASNFKLPEREQDFLDAFEQVVDKCLEKKVEFVVHSGDVFDVPKPRNRVLVFLVEQLKKLKNQGIPFFTIPGSHDVGVDGTFITVLEKVGLLTNLGNSRYFEQQGDKILLKGEVFKNVFLAGVPGRRAGITEVYRNLEPVFQESIFKVFVFHHTVSDANAFFSDITTSILPKGFDYYAAGHWHKRFTTLFNNAPIVYPGSLENCDTKEMSYQEEKGFFFVNFDKGPSYGFEPVKSREIQWENVNCNALTPEQVEKKCLELMKKVENQPLLILKLKGILSKGSRSEINRSRILKQAIGKGYLYAHTSISDLSNPVDDVHVSVMEKSVQSIEREFLTKKGFKGDDLRLAEKIIETLGREMTPQEIQASQKSIVQEIEGLAGL